LESKRLLQTEMHGVPVPLSTRELEVLELVRLGHQNKEIAAKLSITTRTVSFHVANLLKKHGTYSRRLL
jgi:DNA-binding NarL/FixJ family response regulator